MRTKVGENDKCIFYRDERCEEIDADRLYQEKYGPFFSVMAMQKDTSLAHKHEEYLIIERATNEPVAVVTYHNVEDILKRELEYLGGRWH